MVAHAGYTLVWSLLLVLGDLVSVVVGMAVASQITQPTDIEVAGWYHFQEHLSYLLMFVIIWPFFAIRFRLFQSRRRDRLSEMMFDVCKALAATLVVCGFVVAFLWDEKPSREFLTICALFTLGLLIVFRTLVQMLLWSMRARGLDRRHILVIGANPRTKDLLRTLQHNPHFGYRVLGLLEDEPERCRMLEAYGIPLLGKFDSLESVLTQHVVDEVFIGLPVSSRYETIQSMAHLCEGVGVGVRMIADLFPLRLATSRFQKLEHIPILALSTVPEHQGQLFLQRLTDAIVASLALIGLSPILIATAVAIKLDSRGPVFFLQERVGQNQRRFKMIKFRSMVVNAEQLRRQVERLNEADGPVFKARNDPRMTRVGRFIRKYSIDELPQLINVLLGHMSLVGPRPPLPNEVAQYSWNQRRRLSVKPGMTGLSQVRGRSDLSFKETVDLDLAYIDGWSLYLVFRILLQTIPAVLRGRGAM